LLTTCRDGGTVHPRLRRLIFTPRLRHGVFDAVPSRTIFLMRRNVYYEAPARIPVLSGSLSMQALAVSQAKSVPRRVTPWSASQARGLIRPGRTCTSKCGCDPSPPGLAMTRPRLPTVAICWPALMCPPGRTSKCRCGRTSRRRCRRRCRRPGRSRWGRAARRRYRIHRRADGRI
jgi:hypothetical protein